MKFKLFSTAFAFLTLSFLFSGETLAQESGEVRYALRGTLLTPDGVIKDGTILISGKKIEAVGADVKLSRMIPVFDTGGIICPGFIDLHNHLTWNVFPRWKAGRKFPNRYEWQQVAEYKMALDGPHRTLIAQGLGKAMARYTEVKALSGGATSLAGLYSEDLLPEERTNYHGLIRMLELSSGFYPDGTPEKIRYEVFPLTMMESYAGQIRRDLESHVLKSLLIHLGEGSPVDASSILEFKILKARGFLLPGVSLIHGVALHAPEFAEMSKVGMGLVWSPRSNFELYGATADVAAAHVAGIKIALAPDWSPSGSDGVIEELKYAAVWNDSLPTPLFSDADLVRMATINAAQLAGVEDKVGSLKSGLYADLLVIKKAGSDPYHALVHADPTDIEMVVVGGQPIYGEPDFTKKVAPQVSWQAVMVGSTAKAVTFPSATSQQPWTETMATLRGALTSLGTHLGALVEDK
ncbi:MAG TPA: amidohydrolase family protein [Opitutaceae bacterium]|nr:amidohydrolase family protein [Opitutaceae bacterium]